MESTNIMHGNEWQLHDAAEQPDVPEAELEPQLPEVQWNIPEPQPQEVRPTISVPQPTVDTVHVHSIFTYMGVSNEITSFFVRERIFDTIHDLTYVDPEVIRDLRDVYSRTYVEHGDLRDRATARWPSLLIHRLFYLQRWFKSFVEVNAYFPDISELSALYFTILPEESIGNISKESS